MKNTAQNPEWSRARGLLADLNKAARIGVSAQILLGKELSVFKRKLGFTHGSKERFSSQVDTCPLGSFQRVTEKETPKTWEQWCQAELGISYKTADRYIACFEYALGRAKAHKAKVPEAFRLLVTPAAELTGDELERLAEHVSRLVMSEGLDGQPLTQRQILEELGIVKPAPRVGGDTSAFKKPGRQMTLGEWATHIFEKIPREFDELERGIFRIKDAPDYRLLLQELPLDSPEDGAISLMGIKECLERVLSGGVGKILTDVESAIEGRMLGDLPKKRTRKLSNHNKK